MGSHKAEHAGDTASKGRDQIKEAVGGAAKTAADAADDRRPQVAEALDDAAEAVGKRAAGKRYSRTAKDKLHDAADYVRDTNGDDMSRDASDVAVANPMTSLLLLGAVIVGGSLLVAAMLDGDTPSGASSERPRALGLSSAVSGLGPKGTETLNRLRDAAFSFALAKAVDAADDIWPGFREHYERS